VKTTAALLLAGLLVGCASVDVESFDTRDEQRPATTAGKVVVFDGEDSVDRPYRRIGALQWWGRNADAESVNAALREEAARIGADGVVRIDDEAKAAGPFFWHVEYVSGFAEAISFEPQPER